jgi:hypothetical protein
MPTLVVGMLAISLSLVGKHGTRRDRTLSRNAG